ncbi:MAG: hypothetical protein ACLQHS_01010 [Candidatus Limnocylindrales bacterium]
MTTLRTRSTTPDPKPSTLGSGTYRGNRRDVYLRTLAAYIADLGGSPGEGEGRDLVAQIGSRRITLRFG